MNQTNSDGNLVLLGTLREYLEFTRVDDTPLISSCQACLIGLVALTSLSLGLAAHLRILKTLWEKNGSKSSNAIDLLFFAHHIVSFILHPPIFIYFVLKNFFYPMSALIGKAGCAIILIGFDIFTRSFVIFLPASVALVRYLLVSNPHWFIRRSPIRLVKIIIASTLLILTWMTMAMHLSVGTIGNKSFNYCVGRFESYFSPLDSDTTSPGYGPFQRQCDPSVRIQLFEKIIAPISIMKLFSDLFVFGGCCLSWISFWIVAVGIPEFILYPITFYKIHQHNRNAEKNGILNPEAFRWRRQTNRINILTSVYIWILQLVCYTFLTIFIQLAYGKNKFLHSLFAVISLSLNFTLIPICFITATDIEFKIALANCNFDIGIKMLVKKLFFFSTKSE